MDWHRVWVPALSLLPQGQAIITKTTKAPAWLFLLNNDWGELQAPAQRCHSRNRAFVSVCAGIVTEKRNVGICLLGLEWGRGGDKPKSGEVLQARELLHRVLWGWPELGGYRRQVQAVRGLAPVPYGNFFLRKSAFCLLLLEPKEQRSLWKTQLMGGVSVSNWLKQILNVTRLCLKYNSWVWKLCAFGKLRSKYPKYNMSGQKAKKKHVFVCTCGFGHCL